MTQGRYRLRQGHIRICAPETSSEDLAAILEQDGCLVLNNFLSSDQVDAIDDDLKPFLEATMRSNSEFGGFKTTRKCGRWHGQGLGR